MRNPTDQEIMAKCPEVIPAESIRLKNVGGRPKKHGTDKHTWYSEDDRIRAAATYAMVGNAAEAARITGLPSDRIRRWKTEPWWHQVIERIRSEKDDELDVKFTKIIDKTVDIINDRLEKGDTVYDARNQTFVQKPVAAKETAVITSIFMDKRTLLRDKQSKHQESEAVMDRIKKLADEFDKLTRAKRARDITDQSEVIVQQDEHSETPTNPPV